MIRRTLRAVIVMLFSVHLASMSHAQTGIDYTVGIGDRLSVSIYGKPELSGTFEVRADGQVVLHLLGGIPAAGSTIREIEQRIVAEAQDRFSSRESVLVDMAMYRNVFVAGVVETPGAYEYRPGLTVMKAIALAGGFKPAPADVSADRDVDAAQRRAIEARSKLTFAEAEQAAIAEELARLTDGGDPAPVEADDPVRADQYRLVDLRRALSARVTEGAERKLSLAGGEADLFSQRRDLINSQLAATQEQLSGMQNLAERGLARREQTLQLEINADKFRSDALEAAAFEARARQTAANAESDIRVAQMEYRHKLLADNIAADQRAELARAEMQLATNYLRETNPAALQGLTDLGAVMPTVFEIHRQGQDAPLIGNDATALAPDDLLVVRLETVGQ